MTHRANCTLTNRGKKALEEIAEEVWHEARTIAMGGGGQETLQQIREDAIDMAEREYGLQVVGQGAGRIVFQAQPEPPDIIEEEAKCVAKVAYWNARYNDLGQRQNRAEIKIWQNLAPMERDLFVPVKDWDHDDYLWLSMSMVKTQGITMEDVDEATNQAQKYGWECSDLNQENVGRVHGDVRILDYAHCSLE